MSSFTNTNATSLQTGPQVLNSEIDFALIKEANKQNGHLLLDWYETSRQNMPFSRERLYFPWFHQSSLVNSSLRKGRSEFNYCPFARYSATSSVETFSKCSSQGNCFVLIDPVDDNGRCNPSFKAQVCGIKRSPTTKTTLSRG